MAFYADVYGYIKRKSAQDVPASLIESLGSSCPIFRHCFATPVASRGLSYVSFADSLKIDSGEAEIWITPFEALLSEIEFVYAQVIVDHEDSDGILMWTYVKTGAEVSRIRSRFDSASNEESPVR